MLQGRAFAPPVGARTLPGVRLWILDENGLLRIKISLSLIPAILDLFEVPDITQHRIVASIRELAH